MDDLEFEILDAIYFVEPFETLVNEVSEKRIPVIKDCLKQLIDRKWVKVMVWNNDDKTYVSSPFFDSDKMEDFHYLITKEGLFGHNSR